MDTLLIVNKEGICLEQTLSLGIFNIGNSKDNDLILPFISDVNISFLRNENFCLPKINGDARSSEGPWGKKVEKQCVLTFEDYTFIYFPNILIQRSKVKDWDASTFPREADKNDYPEKLLIFLLNVIQADQGAILFLRESILKVVVSKKIEFQDQSEVFLQRILESKKEEMVINMSYNTHTLLFKSGLTPLDFCLIQYPVGIDKVVLYLPRTKNMAALPEGILTTLLSLSAGNLATHLLLKNQKELRKKIGEIEFDFFWGNSEKMNSLKNYVDKLCRTNLSLLIHGETGTGKEMLVKYINQKSSVGKVISVNCAAIPKDLAESILFGHKNGAFTGAHNDQVGKLQEADGGILFLDEIGELDLNIQAKLLRAIQENKITPLGGKEIEVKFWLICATHRNIEKMIEEGLFREDLYFRINEARIGIPSLNERQNDVPILATHFADEIVRANGLGSRVLSIEVLEYLKTKKWRGNIRELKGFIRKIILLSDSKVITLKSLESLNFLENSADTFSYPQDLQEAKRLFVESHIKKILSQCGGNKSKAARLMGITARNLYRILPENQDNYDLFN